IFFPFPPFYLTGKPLQKHPPMEGWNQTTSAFFLLGLFPPTKIGLLLFLLVILIFLIGCLGNSTMILLIWMDHHLHTPMYFLLSQLSLMDLMYICSTVPKMAINFLSGDNSISLVACGFQSFCFLLIAGSEAFLLASMAIDRYVAICHPLNYPILMNKRICLLLVAGSWFSSSINSICHTMYVFSMPYFIDHFFREIPAMLKLPCVDTSHYERRIYVSAVIFLLIPFSIILPSYGQILHTVLHIRSVEAQKKAFSICSSHLTVVVMYYGPFIFTYMRPKSYHTPGQDSILAILYTILTPMLNPIIYSLRNKDVLCALKKVLGKALMHRK
uniref:Olfactory receptor n=1 Tax=Vombatus ursinus TaxID=29139 RepID=A0A4X2KLM0_VOMUR